MLHSCSLYSLVNKTNVAGVLLNVINWITFQHEVMLVEPPVVIKDFKDLPGPMCFFHSLQETLCKKGLNSAIHFLTAFFPYFSSLTTPKRL